MSLSRFAFFTVTVAIFAVDLQAYVAQIIRINGDAQVTHLDGLKDAINLKTTLNNGDKIEVASKSRTQMRFNDGTVVTLGRDSIFSIDEYLYDSTDKSKAEFNIIKGSFKFLTGNIGKIAPKHFKLKAKTATMGVRGTYVAGNFKENVLGVLYLGMGNGVYVENEYGRSDLTEIGQGVFVGLNEVPKTPSFWNKSQSDDLLKEVNFKTEDALPKESREYLNRASIDANLGLYTFSNHNDNSDIDTAGTTVELEFTTPSYNNFSADVGFFAQIPLGIMKDATPTAFSRNLNSMHSASIAWKPSNSIVRIGRQKLTTPLSDSSNLRGRPSLELRNHWYEDRAKTDWWWSTPSAFEAISAELYEIQDLKIVASASQKFKRSALDNFSSTLPSVNDFGNIYLAGLEYKLGPTKLQLYNLYADEFINTAYLQADLLKDHEKWGYFGAAQYIHQRDVQDFSQDVRSSLWGVKAGAYYKGWQLWTALSQTQKNRASEINALLTPFDGMNAFTNSYALRNVLAPTYNTPLSSDGAYASDTFGQKIAVEYDGNYDRLSPFSAMFSFAQYDQKSAQSKATAFDLDLSYKFEKKLQGLSMTLKASKVKNSDFIKADENIAQFMTRYSF